MLAIKPYQELMKLFLGSTRDVIEVLGLEIGIFSGWCQLVLQVPLLRLLLINLGQHKIRFNNRI